MDVGLQRYEGGNWFSVAQEMIMEWIKCSEQMPDIGERVLVVTRGIYVGCASYRQREGAKTAKGRAPRFEDFGGIVYNVTHWQPLPKPPTE